MNSALKRLLPFVFAVLPLKAMAAGEFCGILVDNNLTPGFSPHDTSIAGQAANVSGTTGSAIGAGLLLGTSSTETIGFEAGIIYLNRSYSIKSKVPFISAETQSDTYSQTALEVPLLARLNLASFFSLGLGAYYAYGFGQVSKESDGKLTNGGVKTSGKGSYGDMQMAQADYGLLVSAAFKIHYEPTRAVLIEGRYAMGLNDVNKDFTSSTPHTVEKYSEFQLIVGIQRSF